MTRIAILFVGLVGCANNRADHPGVDGGVDPDSPGDGATGDSTKVVPCTGVMVPGDYASLQTALDAVAAAGQDATICLGDGTLMPPVDHFTIGDPGHHGKALRIEGRGRDSTHLAGFVETTSGGWGSVTIEHVTIDTAGESLTVLYGPAHFELRDCKLAAQIAIDTYYVGAVDATVDRCEIGVESQSLGRSIMMVSNMQSLTVKVTNSYLHGELESQTWTTGLHSTLSFVNNTVVGPKMGIDLTDELAATIANNIFTGANTYAMGWDSHVTVTARNNALWGNAANYGALATEGASYVKTDCGLDANAPVPGVGSTSPCHGAADVSLAPPYDFYDTPRGAVVDIGAVQGP